MPKITTHDREHDTSTAGSTKHGREKEFSMDNNDGYTTQIIVSDPQKHANDPNSSTAYVTYQISTKTNNPSYHKNHGSATTTDIIVVHRRYSDLVLLHDILSNDNPTRIIPPLPDKKVFQYIAGDRFSQRFTQKRCHSLQNFLKRVSTHPILSKASIFEQFLVSNEWEAYRRSLSGNLQTNKEEVSDTIMNAFKTVHNQSEEFIEIKEKSDKLDHTISKLSKNFHKVVRKNDSIADDYSKLSQSLQDLNEVVSNEDEMLANKLRIFNEGIKQISYGLSDLNKYLDYEYTVDLKDLEHYIDSLHQSLKLKDQKQIDYEQLSEFLTKSIKEKNNLISGTGGGNYFTTKLEALAGVNQEASRREKIVKLETKITTLTGELDNAKKVADGFEQETLKEVDLFEKVKSKELKESLGSLADHHIQFYEKMVETWTKVDKSL
ncbi:Snx4p NDAI_0C02290 [Naumovozyma dairenensis CBS 421]|uniref:Sorting nexin-4 n=1 Tax=Naumovozyma dairenensis (strain ATCC 10597 / BCRC 20456 / CBS 421 / NBRC 0211 / NRRL Y-12639) TaxID=1071378 RepID=G0W7X8_NAUDC|nr:hypothetical protein NDAI_0C02290 [Naumovozyma dairenensis CBS 421]CCD23889.1 hypothetical protein NDAI_0C02290 [Naumovozyma dairenensis CBS 421]